MYILRATIKYGQTEDASLRRLLTYYPYTEQERPRHLPLNLQIAPSGFEVVLDWRKQVNPFLLCGVVRAPRLVVPAGCTTETSRFSRTELTAQWASNLAPTPNLHAILDAKLNQTLPKSDFKAMQSHWKAHQLESASVTFSDSHNVLINWVASILLAASLIYQLLKNSASWTTQKENG